MPSSVADTFAAAGLVRAGAVKWGAAVPEVSAGDYVVALTDDPASLTAARHDAPIDQRRLVYLLHARPQLLLDGRRPTVEELAARLSAFWCRDEVILYIGLAGTSLRRRVGEYYKTPLAARRPHAGGWWLKTLDILDDLWVHYAATPDHAAAELAMLQHFAVKVSEATTATLHDRRRPAPFANLRTADGTNKAHGITGATGELTRRVAGTATSGPPCAPPPVKRSPRTADAVGGPHGPAVSQNVTAKDVEAGRIRFPRGAKSLFPPDRVYIVVVIRGHRFESVRWDPRTAGDTDRSGVLAFGKRKLDGVVDVGDVLGVLVDDDGAVLLR